VFTYHHYLKAMWPTQQFFESQVMILAGYQFPHAWHCCMMLLPLPLLLLASCWHTQVKEVLQEVHIMIGTSTDFFFQIPHMGTLGA
jgi:hypothetical protein